MLCVDEALKIWLKIINKITNIPSNLIINGESIRGVELVYIKNAQRIPLTSKDNFIVFYLDYIDDISVTDSADSLLTTQSYELHLIIYGDKCKVLSHTLKANIYSESVLNILRDNDIGLQDIPSIENTSNFINENTYQFRNDMRIRFNCVIESDKIFDINEIDDILLDGRVL